LTAGVHYTPALTAREVGVFSITYRRGGDSSVVLDGDTPGSCDQLLEKSISQQLLKLFLRRCALEDPALNNQTRCG
jgi:hypothetical protein